MAKSRQQKEESVKMLSERLSGAKAVVFTNFDGLKVNDTNELRNALRASKVDYSIAKRTLLKLAFAKANLKDIDLSNITGGLGVAISTEDEILPAKVLAEFAKTHKELKLIGGIFNGKFIDAKEVAELANLPGKDELYAKIVWLFNYPVSGLVNVLAGNLKSLVYVLQAIKDKK